MSNPDPVRHACSAHKNLSIADKNLGFAAALLHESKCLSGECLPNSSENCIDLSRSQRPWKVQHILRPRGDMGGYADCREDGCALNNVHSHCG